MALDGTPDNQSVQNLGQVDRYQSTDPNLFDTPLKDNKVNPQAVTTVYEAYNIFKNYLEGNKIFRDAAQEAQFVYDGNQYDAAAKAKLISDGRAPVVFNFIKDKVKTMLGMLMQKPFRFSFNPGLNQSADKSYYMNEIAFRDRDLGDWDYSEMEFMKDFLIHTGCLVIYEDKSKDPFGHINLKKKPIASVLFDPDWITSDEDDNEHIHLMDWMSPYEMEGTFGPQVKDIRQAVELYEKNRAAAYKYDDIEERRGGFDRSPEYFNKSSGKYLVVEMLTLVPKTKVRKFNQNTMAWFDEQPQEVQQLINDAVQLGNFDNPWVEIEVPYKELETIIFCPALSLTDPFVEGLHDVQIGHYPLIIGSAENSNGLRCGMVQDYIDPQKLFNKTHSMFLHWQQTVTSGVEFIDASKFEDSKEAQRYIDEGNIPGSVFFVKDLDRAVKAKERPNNPIDFEKTLNSAISFMEQVGPPPAALGMSEGDSESGVLYNAKRQQSFIKTAGYTGSLKRVSKRLGEMYVEMAPQIYGDNVPRYWLNSKQKPMAINLDTDTSLSDVGRLSVSVIEGPVGASVKEEYLALFFQLKSSTSDPLIQSELDALIGKNIPGIDSATLEEYNASTRLARDLNKRKYAVALLQFDQQYKQTLSMVSQAGAQQAMMNQQPGQGQSGQGQLLPPPPTQQGTAGEQVVGQRGVVPLPQQNPVSSPRAATGVGA
jgi:hypothetical protein